MELFTHFCYIICYSIFELWKIFVQQTLNVLFRSKNKNWLPSLNDYSFHKCSQPLAQRKSKLLAPHGAYVLCLAYHLVSGVPVLRSKKAYRYTVTGVQPWYWHAAYRYWLVWSYRYAWGSVGSVKWCTGPSPLLCLSHLYK